MKPDRLPSVMSTLTATVWLMLMTSYVTSQSLRHTKEAAVDSRVLDSLTAKAIATYAYSNTPFRVQLWEKVTHPLSSDFFKLSWQVEFTPNVTGHGQYVYNLNTNEEVNITSSYKVGIINKDIPGPTHGIFKDGLATHVRLSFEDTTQLWNNVVPGSLVEFDDLTMPYQLPVFFCTEHDCPGQEFDFGDVHSTTETQSTTTTTATTTTTESPDPQPVVNKDDDDDDEDFLESRDFAIALLVWNIVLTILVLIIIMVLMSICADMDKRKNERRREQKARRMKGADNPAIAEGHVAAESTWRSGTSFDPSVVSSDREPIADISEATLEY